jgi:RecA-family ATPase
MAALRARYKPEKEPPLCVVPCLLNLFNPGADLRELVELVHRWSELCGEKTVMIVLDTLARIIGSGDENTARDMGVLIQNIDKLRVATGAHVMVVHHSGKTKANGARGSSALRAATDTEIEVEGGRIKVRKQRATEEAKDVAFRLKSVVIGKKEGHDATSCVVDKGAALDFEPLLTHEQQEWLEQLKAFAELLGREELTHKDMQIAWASPPLEGGDHDRKPCPMSTVKKRSTTLKQIGTLVIVSECREKPVRYKLSLPIATSSPP